MEYKADRFAIGGSTNSTTDTITGVVDGRVYQTERYGTFKYDVPVTNASYSVKLHFVEMYQTTAGARLFSASVEGQPALQNVDLFAAYGHDVAYEVIIENVMVADESLTIDLTGQIDNAQISGFAIYSNDNGEFVEPPDTGLNGPFSGGMADGEMKFLGNILNGPRADYPQYWNQVTMENAGKLGPLMPSRGTFNWGPIDSTYAFAQTHNIIFKHHVFVWGSQEPNWIKDGGGLSNAVIQSELENLMRLYCQRYPDNKIIDVVNEPLHAPATFRNSIGGAGSTGWDWVVWSFEKARQYCPGQILVLNDYGIINDPNAIQRYKVIINALKSRGLIDAVGIQAHAFSVDNMTATQLKNNLDNLAQTGLPIHVTELDIRGNDEVQRDRYSRLFPVFWEHPAVAGVTIWGDDHSWLSDGDARLLINGQPRPALTWMQSYFAQRRANR